MSLFIKERKPLVFPYGQPPEGWDVLWRVEAVSYSVVIDADADLYGSTDPVLEARWHRVKKRTPKGARLFGGTFVLLTATKKFACNTVEDALVSFKARRVRQIAILEAKLKRARYELELAS